MEVSVKTELTLQIAHALQRAAARKRLLPYQDFHSLCGRETPLVQRYAALEAAINMLCEPAQVDYGVLLTCDGGLPGPDFFARFRKERFPEFVAVMGDPRYHRQSIKQKRVLVERERGRVYAHVETVARLEDRLERV
jgi:hypothetical protein